VDTEVEEKQMSNHQPLVSVLTPCYNGEKHVSKLLDSVLMQDYPKIEMLVINDGSTDGTAKVIKSYIPKFKEKGFGLEYRYQKNQGQSVAINNGLKWVRGDYLVWPDADDYYSSKKTISKMVEVLKSSDDSVSLVQVLREYVDERGEVVWRQEITSDNRYKTDLFEDGIFGRNGFRYPPGAVMAKVSKIDELIPDREIYTEKDAGQNFQLYIPLSYKHQFLTIEEYLYRVMERSDSHSRTVATLKNRKKVYYRTMINTLKKMDLDKDYFNFLKKEYLRTKM